MAETAAAKNETLPAHVARLSKAELMEFTSDLIEGRVFTSDHISPEHVDMLSVIFMPLAVGLFSEAPESYIQEVGILWAKMEDAEVARINGYPIFTKCHVMHKDDWDKCYEVNSKFAKDRGGSLEAEFDDHPGP